MSRKASRRRNSEATKMVSLRLPQWQIDQVRAIAQREGNGASAVIRRLLSEALKPLRRTGDDR
jgi:Ribbon-helix-helix protein, copG family